MGHQSYALLCSKMTSFKGGQQNHLWLHLFQISMASAMKLLSYHRDNDHQIVIQGAIFPSVLHRSYSQFLLEKAKVIKVNELSRKFLLWARTYFCTLDSGINMSGEKTGQKRGTLHFLNSKPVHFIMEIYLYKRLMT